MGKSQSNLIRGTTEQMKTHERSSWKGKWVLVLHGWAGLALSLGPLCSDMSVLRSAASVGDDRLIQTYSNAGNPNGSIRTSAPSVKLFSIP